MADWKGLATMNDNNNDDGTETFDVVVTRVLGAPIGEAWKAWSEPEYVRSWWGPTPNRVYVTQFRNGFSRRRCVAGVHARTRGVRRPGHLPHVDLYQDRPARADRVRLQLRGQGRDPSLPRRDGHAYRSTAGRAPRGHLRGRGRGRDGDERHGVRLHERGGTRPVESRHGAVPREDGRNVR